MPSGALFGVASAISFGIGDFAGGLASRRSSAVRVAAGAMLVGLFLIGALAAVLRPPFPDARGLLLAVAAGIGGGIGLTALYRGMALGAIGLVSSLSAAGALGLPLLASLLLGTGLTWPQLAGMACAGAAAALAGGSARADVPRTALVMAGLAAAAFGAWYVLLDLAAANGDPLWALVISRSTSCVLVGAVAWRARGGAGQVPVRLVGLSGTADVGGNAFFVLSGGVLPVGLAAALSGLYPVVATLLARWILNEHLSRPAQAAVGLAIAGIVLISLGGDLQ
jgi:drug/metabolite transporter (DMT)-like permease